MKLKLELDVRLSDDECSAILTHPALVGELELVCGTPAQLSQTLKFLQVEEKPAGLLTYPEGVREVTDAIAKVGKAFQSFKPPTTVVKEK